MKEILTGLPDQIREHKVAAASTALALVVGGATLGFISQGSPRRTAAYESGTSFSPEVEAPESDAPTTVIEAYPAPTDLPASNIETEKTPETDTNTLTVSPTPTSNPLSKPSVVHSSASISPSQALPSASQSAIASSPSASPVSSSPPSKSPEMSAPNAEVYAENELERKIANGEEVSLASEVDYYWKSQGSKTKYEFVTYVPLEAEVTGGGKRYFQAELPEGGQLKDVKVTILPKDGTTTDSEHSAYYNRGCEPSRSGIVYSEDGILVSDIRYEDGQTVTSPVGKTDEYKSDSVYGRPPVDPNESSLC